MSREWHRPIIHDEGLELMHTGSVCLIFGAAMAILAGDPRLTGALQVAVIAVWLLPLLTYLVGKLCVRGSWYPWLTVGATVLCGGLTGFVLTTMALQAGLHARLPLADDGADAWLIGRICSLPAVGVDRTRVELCRKDVDRLRRVRLNLYGSDRPTPQLGETWAVRARLRVPLSYLNPAGPDLAAAHLFKGRDATGSVRVAHRIAEAAWFDRIRQGLADALETSVPTEHGLARAMLVGEQDGLSAEDWNLLRHTGTAHLVAISGLHITLVAGWAAMLAVGSRRLFPGGVRDSAAPLAGLIVAAMYAGLAGWAIPTQRALLMLVVVILAHLARRPRRPMHTLVLAAAVVVMIDPLAVAQVGFWMSVCAVAALMAVDWGRVAVWMSLLRAQLMIVLLTAPLVSLIGGVVGPATLVSNLFAIPWIAIVVLPVALIGAACQMLGLGGLAEILWALADSGLSWMRAGLSLTTSWPSTQLSPPAGLGTAATASIGLIIASSSAGALLIARSPPGRSAQSRSRQQVGQLLALVGGVTCVLLSLTWARVPAVGAASVRAIFVDVGQGLAVIVQTERHNLVYDTGPSWRGGGAAADITLIPVLRRSGVSRIDRMLISHGDDDHAGGARGVRQAFTVVDQLGLDERPCERGAEWSWDGVNFRVLHPPDQNWAGNDGSCVLMVEAAGHRLLLTGDLEALGESALVGSGLLADAAGVEVVLAPHHGSRTSSSEQLVRATRPGLVVVASGRGNRWQLPRIEVLQRWRDVGAEVVITGREGAVTVELSPAGVTWTTELRRAPWPWRAYGMMREPET